MSPSTGRKTRRLAAAGMALAFGFLPIAAAQACEGAAWAPPGFWGPESKWRGAGFGYPGMMRSYKWAVGGNVPTYVCAQGWGFDDAHPHGDWFDVGCSKTGMEVSVPWGNNAASPRFHAKTAGPNGAIVEWQCGDGGPRR